MTSHRIMNALILGGLLLVASCRASHAQEPTKLALGGYLTAAFLDVSITSYCHGQGVCRERNPALRPIVENHGVLPGMTVKGAMHAGIVLWILNENRTHPKRAFWLAVGLTAAQVGVDVVNMRTLKSRTK